MNSPNSEQSVLTVQDLLGLQEFRSAEVSVAAAAHRLGNRVEWVHVFETPFVAEVMRGGEFLLTTGIGLAGMSAGEVDALVAGLAAAGAAGLGFEPSHAPASILVDACRRHDLPLLVFGQDVRFVEITHVVHERLVAGELQTLRRAVALQAQLREAAREGLGVAGLVAALGDVLGAQVLLERADRTPLASSPEGGLDLTFMDALDRRRQRLPTPLHSRDVTPGARLHALGRHADELESLAVDEAAFLLSVALTAQPPRDEVPSAERARLLGRLAEGRAGSAADIVRGGRSVGVDLSRSTLWAFHARGGLARLERMEVDALVDGRRALVAVRGDVDPRRLARELVRRGGAIAVGIDTRGGEPWQVRDALAAAERACLVAAAAGPPVRSGSELGGLASIARDALAGERVRTRFDDAGLRLVEALVATGWSKSAAARRLRISRQRLYERIGAESARHSIDLDVPQTRVEVALEVWAARMAELAAT
jgi:purine catabolism regulator